MIFPISDKNLITPVLLCLQTCSPRGLSSSTRILEDTFEGLGLGLEAEVLGLGLEAQVLGLGLGLVTQVLGLGLEAQVLITSLMFC